jgi:hypothetical protein
MRAEDFFPLGWLDKPFRRQPYPDMTYGEALETAILLSWDMNNSADALAVHDLLSQVHVRMQVDHAQFGGRSMQSITELSELWRGKVTTLLKTSGGTK